MAPKVSIVIPTLNRSHLLRFSLRSAVEQTYSDLEIVVSNNRSEDDTADVIQSFEHPGLVTVVPDRRLNMPENFEFGLRNATGDYLTFITDDTYLLSDCIERAIDTILKLDVPLVVWTNAIYADPRWVERQRRNTLYIPRSSHRASLRDSRASVRHWYRRIRASGDKPRAINCLCSREVIEAARRAQGSFFLPPSPDHSAGVGMLLNSSRYAYLDEPLVIDVLAPESTGASGSFTMGKSAEEFWKSFGRDMDEVAFLGLPTNAGTIAQSMSAVRRFYPGRCPDLDLENVLSEIVDNVAKLEAYGNDVRHFYRTIFGYAAQMSLRLRLRLTLKRLTATAKWRAVRLVRSSPLLFRIETLRGFDVLRPSSTEISSLGRLVSERNGARRSYSDVAPRPSM